MESPKFIKPSYNLFLCCIICISSLVILEANIANPNDKYWKSKALQAEKIAEKAFEPNPQATTNSFNKEVKATLSSKKTMSNADESSGACQATNPIDQCWRCRADWADDRKRLANCAKGFAQGTTGGASGEIYTVTDPSDSDVATPKNGTLRWGAIQPQPLWIVFDKDMVIALTEELMIQSSKTLDGRGAKVEIANGCQLTIQFVHNVIIHNLHIHDIKSCPGGMVRDSTDHSGLRTKSDGDAVSVFGSSNVWVDHITASKCADGLVDLVNASTAITISNSLFTDHDHVMLFGASDTNSNDKIIQATVAFNHFGKGLVQRMPRVRWGFAHVVNNDYTHWLMYAIGGSYNATILSQGNRFSAPDDPKAKEVTHRADAPESVWKNWIWRSQDDLMENGAVFVESGDNTTQLKETDLVKSEPGASVASLTQSSGALSCQIGKEC